MCDDLLEHGPQLGVGCLVPAVHQTVHSLPVACHVHPKPLEIRFERGYQIIHWGVRLIKRKQPSLAVDAAKVETRRTRRLAQADELIVTAPFRD